MSETVDQLLSITDAGGNTTIGLDGTTGNVTVGGGGQMGTVVVRGSADIDRIRLDSLNSKITCSDSSGNALVEIGVGPAGTGRICLDASNNNIVLKDEDENIVAQLGVNGNLVLGGGVYDGDVRLKDAAGNETIALSAGEGTLRVGGNGVRGEITLKSTDGITGIELDGGAAEIVVGSQGRNGYVRLQDSSMVEVITISANSGNITCGANGKDGDLIVRNEFGQETIHLHGSSGDIILSNADCAEEFDVCGEGVEPGSVMVLDGESGLRCSTEAYDTRVAGVVSGAGQYKSALVLDRQPGTAQRVPVALIGKVYCKVDARYGAIRVGDLLTTSPTPGCAMRASDPVRAFGAILGKALRALEQGERMIPILVTLG